MYAVVDIETTGSHVQRHSITEIAVIHFDGENVTDEFTTLVQPDAPIPGFISHFTGITNAMAEHAPLWEEVMDRINEMTKNRVLIAHNAHFDYSFLKSSFLRYGQTFQRKTLCTLKLARQLFPGLGSYSLDNLCKHFEINSLPVHRALEDAKAALSLFQLLHQHDQHGIIAASLKKRSNEYTLPPHLLNETLRSLPEVAGVYYFLDEHQHVLYIGKAKNIRARIHQHFTANSSTRSRTRLMNSIHDIRYHACGNELVAMLMESAEIKKHFPPFNVIQKIADNNFGLYCYEDGNGYLRLAMKRLKRGDQPLVSFSSLQEARAFLNEKRQEFLLCPKLSGLQLSSAACFDHTVGKCDGACKGDISCDDYNVRVIAALKAIKADSISCAIFGEGRTETESSVVLMENGSYRGYGFVPKEISDKWTEEDDQGINLLKETVEPQRDNREVQMIIRNYLHTRSDFNIHWL